MRTGIDRAEEPLLPTRFAPIPVALGGPGKTGDHEPFAMPQRRPQRLGEPPRNPRANHQPIDDRLDLVHASRSQLRKMLQVADLPVHAGTHEPRLANLGHHFLVLPTSPADQRREDHDFGAGGQARQFIEDLLRRLLRNGLAALRAVGCSEACHE